jgi:hypothetical protein
MSKRWPHIRRFLRVNRSSGWIDGDYLIFHCVRHTLSSDDQAAAYEEWADFYEFRTEQQLADELAGDHRMRGLVEEWTDDMVYACRRCAAIARGEDPGEPVPLSVRRPDLYAAKRARVAEFVANVEAHRQPARHLRKSG